MMKVLATHQIKHIKEIKVISPATAQRAALQSGIKTRQGLCYLLNNDPEFSRILQPINVRNYNSDGQTDIDEQLCGMTT